MSRRYRILFIAHDTEKSGAPRVTTELARRFAARRHDVTLCFPRRGGIEAEARAAGLRIEIVPNPPVSLAAAGAAHRFSLAWARLRALLLYWRLARRRRYDVVWVGSYIAVIAGVAGWLARRPVIYHIHEDIVPTRMNRARIALVKLSARALVFVARASVGAFVPRPRRQRWVHLANFVDPARFDGFSRDESLRAELAAAPGDVVFLTAAFLSPRKGIDVLLRAFGRLAGRSDNAVLWIAGEEGEGHGAYARELRAWVEQHGLGKRVRFLGHREDVPRLMKCSDVYVLASRNEALPLAIAEAMTAALPVVATNVGSVREMILENESGVIVGSENDEELARAMERYACDGELRRAHGVKGKARAAVMYNPEAICARAEKLIERVCN